MTRKEQMETVKLLETTRDEENNAVSARLQLPSWIDFPAQLQMLKNSGAHDILDEFGTSADSKLQYVERPAWLNEHGLHLLRLSAADKTDDATFVNLRLQAPDSADAPPDDATLQAALTLATRRFDWDLDMEAVKKALLVNEYGMELVGRFYPAVPANLPGAWEGLLKTVISNQIYPGLAVRLLRGLLEFYSDRKAHIGGKEYRYYPSPEFVATLDQEDLLGLKFSRQKAKFLPGIANMLLENPEKFDWERLRSLPGPEAVAILDELPGVGVWTANYVGMRGLPHWDVFIDEGGLRKLLANVYDRRAELSDDEFTKLTEVFAPYRSIACYYSYMKMYDV
jgi:3-methyladenine DNA glycosylase/8-oxoguanine DNA glycosylase